MTVPLVVPSFKARFWRNIPKEIEHADLPAVYAYMQEEAHRSFVKFGYEWTEPMFMEVWEGTWRYDADGDMVPIPEKGYGIWCAVIETRAWKEWR